VHDVRDIMTWASFSSLQWRKNNDTGSPVSLGGVEMPSTECITKNLCLGKHALREITTLVRGRQEPIPPFNVDI
jgi:hypothetical protein